VVDNKHCLPFITMALTTVEAGAMHLVLCLQQVGERQNLTHCIAPHIALHHPSDPTKLPLRHYKHQNSPAQVGRQLACIP